MKRIYRWLYTETLLSVLLCSMLEADVLTLATDWTVCHLLCFSLMLLWPVGCASAKKCQISSCSLVVHPLTENLLWMICAFLYSITKDNFLYPPKWFFLAHCFCWLGWQNEHSIMMVVAVVTADVQLKRVKCLFTMRNDWNVCKKIIFFVATVSVRLVSLA